MKINLSLQSNVYRDLSLRGAALDGKWSVGLCDTVVHQLFPACVGVDDVTLTLRRTRGTGCKLVTCGYSHNDLGGLHFRVKGWADEQYITRYTYKALRMLGVLLGWGEQYWVSVVPRAVV